MFLGGEELFLEVVEDALAELVVAGVLRQLGELEVVVDVLRLVNHQVPYVQTLLPLLQVLARLELQSLSPQC